MGTISLRTKGMGGIRVGYGLVQRLGRVLREGGVAPARALIVTDDNVRTALGDALEALRDDLGSGALVAAIRPGEASKCLDTAAELYALLAAERFGRDGVIVAVGGGVVSDLAGFVAGTWMRGIRWVIVPTTLEAQIDAAVGAKTAINVPGGKNLVGVFHPPALVIIDAECLATLPRRELIAGLAESVKHALIDSEAFVRWHEEHVENILALDRPTMLALIEKNLAVKVAVVGRDPHETTGERMILNFGHTIGHAVEECGLNLLRKSALATASAPDGGSAAPGPWRHGECVALGIVAACRLSERLGLIDEVLVNRIVLLLGRFGLPTAVPGSLDAERLLEVMRLDKKVRGGKVKFVLLSGVGCPVVRDDVPEELVRNVLSTA